MKIYIHGSGHLAKITQEYFRSSHPMTPLESAELVWCCEDVDNNVEQVTMDIVGLAKRNRTALFLISSQLPVTTIKHIENFVVVNGYPHFACCPENFKTSDGPNAYFEQERFIIGVRHEEDYWLLSRKLFGFAKDVIRTSVESAEMIKHTINAYLGLCISFINEIRDICEVVGADIQEVEQGLLTESRVSPQAPLYAGEPFGGGHIDRDLSYLQSIKGCEWNTQLIRAIQLSNNRKKK